VITRRASTRTWPPSSTSPPMRRTRVRPRRGTASGIRGGSRRDPEDAGRLHVHRSSTVSRDFAADLPGDEAAFEARSQGLPRRKCSAPRSQPGLEAQAELYMVARSDRIISPDLERMYAARAHSQTVEIAARATRLSIPSERGRCPDRAGRAARSGAVTHLMRKSEEVTTFWPDGARLAVSFSLISRAAASPSRVRRRHPERIEGACPTCRPTPSSRTVTTRGSGFPLPHRRSSRDEPFIIPVRGRDFVTVPYTFHMNDIVSFPFAGGTRGPLSRRSRRVRPALRRGAYRRRMMVVSLHDRISGRPGRVRVLDGFLEYARSKKGVWFARKDEIARFVLGLAPAEVAGRQRLQSRSRRPRSISRAR